MYKPGAWQPGQSGNPRGRPKKGNNLAGLIRNHLEYSALPDGRTKMRALIEVIFQKAMDGRFAHMRFLIEYAYGKPGVADIGNGAIVNGVLSVRHSNMLILKL